MENYLPLLKAVHAYGTGLVGGLQMCHGSDMQQFACILTSITCRCEALACKCQQTGMLLGQQK